MAAKSAYDLLVNEFCEKCYFNRKVLALFFSFFVVIL